MRREIGEGLSPQDDARVRTARRAPARRTTPRVKLQGGDRIRGGSHVGPGHAGRRTLSWIADLRFKATGAVVALCMVVATAFSCVSIPALATSTTGIVTAGRASGEPATAVYCTFEIKVDGVSHKAYCAEAPWQGPSTGDTYVLQGETHLDALDYVLYHGYDGQTVKNLSAPDGTVLSETRSRAATQAAAWMAIGSAYPGNYDDWDGYVEYTDKFKAHDAVGYQTAVSLYEAAHAYAQLSSAVKVSRPEYRFSTLWSKQGDEGRLSGNHTQMLVMVGSKNGQIKVSKVSSELALTSGNASYTVAGAQYGIYADEACTKLVQTLTTGADGSAVGAPLAAGTYWVKEVAASPGFLLDPSIRKVTVNPAETSELDVPEQPATASAEVRLQKLDKEGDAVGAAEAATAQGSATLGGAEFTVNYYAAAYASAAQLPETPTRSWVFATNVRGFVNFGYTQPTGDELYKDGAGNVVFPLGTYAVAETKAPEGYLLSDGSTHLAHVVEDAASETGASWQWGDGWGAVNYDEDVEGRAIADQVIRGGLSVQKVDARTGKAEPEGAASFEGAEFTIYNRGQHAVRIGGVGYGPGKAVMTIVTDEHGYAETGATDLPYGQYEVKETKAPAGYERNSSWSEMVRITEQGVVVHKDDPMAHAEPEMPKLGGLTLEKADQEGGPQGDASLEGIMFGIINRTGGPVWYDGNEYAADEPIAGLVLVTDAEGKAATARDALPIGTYEVYEASPNDGYLVNDETKTVTITEEAAGTLTYVGRFEDLVKRGGVRVGKVSLQSMLRQPEGAATFEGTRIGVRLTSANPVVVDDVRYRSGDTVTTIELDASGIGQTAEDALPYGSYELYEVQAPEGELLNTSWVCPFQIREHGQIVDLSSEELSVPDQVIRGDIETVKAAEKSQQRLSTIPFVLESLTTGEWHVVVTDENGYLSTASSWNAHSSNTNANDSLVVRDEDGSYRLDASAGSLDPAAGVWFSGYADVVVAVDDSLGALPYDSYRLVELGVENNEGLVLLDLPLKVYRDARTVNLGTLDDQPEGEPPVIGTELTYGGDHVAPVAENVTLVDTVSYRNLEVGTDYLLVGELHLVGEDGSDAGVIAQSEQAFTCAYTAGEVEVSFAVDTTDLAGGTAVAFETLFANGSEVAAHADITDQGQTVRFPKIGTKLSPCSDGSVASPTGMITLVDTVSYEGLEPGKSYLLRGTLMDKATGENVLVDGVPVRAEKVFVPTESSGNTEVTFIFDATQLAGTRVVAFEDLVGYTVHADLEDEDQTVSLPRIGTQARVGELDEALAGAQTAILDTVSYENLVPGATYKLVGTLMDKQTGLALENEGEPVTMEATFVPEAANGQTRIMLTFDATGLEGHDVVVFERLYFVGDGAEELVASHEDLQDAGQTIRFPRIKTTLTDADTETHETAQHDAVTLVDTVQYHNLTPGREYLITGELHLKGADVNAGEVIAGANGKIATAQTAFTPDAQEGEVQLSFTLDTNALAGCTIVAFETLSREGVDLAVHADINDEAQSVHVPRIQTTLTDAKSDKHEVVATGDVTLRDVVTFSGLTAGTQYQLAGTLVYQDSGEPVVVEGRPVEGSCVFVPAAPNGEAVVSFTFNAEGLKGRSVVAFETLRRDDLVIATHADLNDAGQTVLVTEKPEEPQHIDPVVPNVPTKPSASTTPKTNDPHLPWLPIAFGGLALLAVGAAASMRSRPDAYLRRDVTIGARRLQASSLHPSQRRARAGRQGGELPGR